METKTQADSDERNSALAALANADAQRATGIYYANSVLADAREELADAIHECVKTGLSLRQVARELNWHHSTVSELLRRVERAQEAGERA